MKIFRIIKKLLSKSPKLNNYFIIIPSKIIIKIIPIITIININKKLSATLFLIPWNQLEKKLLFNLESLMLFQIFKPVLMSNKNFLKFFILNLTPKKINKIIKIINKTLMTFIDSLVQGHSLLNLIKKLKILLNKIFKILILFLIKNPLNLLTLCTCLTNRSNKKEK
jgi:hypothetical protein